MRKLIDKILNRWGYVRKKELNSHIIHHYFKPLLIRSQRRFRAESIIGFSREDASEYQLTVNKDVCKSEVFNLVKDYIKETVTIDKEGYTVIDCELVIQIKD